MVKTRQLERIIQYGLLVLVALMPFHAFLSVWLGHLTGHQTWIQAWKDVVIAGLTIVGAVYLWREPTVRHRLREPWVLAAALFGLLALLAAGGGLATHSVTPVMALYGAKIDLEMLLAAGLAALAATPAFARQLTITALISAGLVMAFALAQIYWLPADFLTRFGYGPSTIRPFLYLTGAPGVYRFGGTLGGPNQLGAYTIIPLSLVLAALAGRRRWLAWAAIPITITLVHTYSRSAWAGAILAGVVLAIRLAPRSRRYWITGAALGLAVIAGVAVQQVIASHPALQEQLLHATLQAHQQPGTSDVEHAASLTAGWEAVRRQPFGYGLGSAGPATFQATHSNIIENQFLQLAYETGWAGIITFVAMLVLLCNRLLCSWYQPWAGAVAAAIIGISFAGLVIPTWDDSTTALIGFTLAGAIAGLPKPAVPSPGRQHV